MQRIFWLSGLLCILFSAASAQDKKAEALLDKVSAQYRALQSLSANFRLEIQDANGQTLSPYSGNIYLKGNKYRIEMDQQTIISNGVTVWTYMPGNREVQVSDAGSGEMDMMNPARLFSGNFKKDFRYTYKGSTSVSGKKVEVVSLKPLRSGSFERIELFVDPASSRITGGEVFDQSGGAFRYTLTNIKTNATIADGRFSFNVAQHPGVEIIDLR